jgi:membrane-associated phospholipid phosphatase
VNVSAWPTMLASEIVTLVYVGYLVLLTARPLAPRSRIQIWAFSTVTILVLLLLASTSNRHGLAVVRDWMPALYILVGYWLSGRFYTGPMLAWETRLAEIDRQLFVTLTDWSFNWTPPPALLACLELAYLSVYVLVPAGFALLYFSRTPFNIDQFWTIVLVAELACFGVLPWIQTRPPRALKKDASHGAPGRLRQTNLAVLHYGSIQVNTFPSGHAAGAVATALAVATWRPKIGLVLVCWAIAIMVGSVVGRYHYAADSVLGAAIGVAAWLIVLWIWR